MLFWRGISQYKELSFIIRCGFYMLGLTIAIVIMLMAIVNTFISLAVNNPYRILVYLDNVRLGVCADLPTWPSCSTISTTALHMW